MIWAGLFVYSFLGFLVYGISRSFMGTCMTEEQEIKVLGWSILWPITVLMIIYWSFKLKKK